MARTPSNMLALKTKMPAFKLPDTDGKLVSSQDFAKFPAILVMFICNHCPFVIHIKKELAHLIQEYQKKGVAVIGINSNDVERYPEDRPEKMKEEKLRNNYTFPYLFDESQEVARAFQAACTPDFYLFDRQQLLVYRGQLDDSRPGNDVLVNGSHLRQAMDEVLENKPVTVVQKPSIGCNIKWKPGNEPGVS